MKNTKLIMYLSAIGTILFWGSAFPVVRFALGGYSPTSLMLLRYFIGSVVLLAFNFAKKSRLPELKDIPLITLSGFLGIFCYTYLFNTASINVSSGVSSFIISSAPIFTLILSLYLLKEKPTKNNVIGLGISFCGLLAISVSELFTSNFTKEVLFLIACAILTSVYNIFQRKILAKYTALEGVTYTIVAATLFMLIFTPELISDMQSAPTEMTLAIVYLGIFPAAAAYYLWNLALSLTDNTNKVTVFLYGTPFVSIVLAFLWLGETISLSSLGGGVLIILGMYYTNKPVKK